MTAYKVRIGRNGRFTIPIEIRQRLGIETGDVMVFSLAPEGLSMSKAQTDSEQDRLSPHQKEDHENG
ncbi:MAG: AbrB/MazE/SpoVT family DNA-binding domain-containing protein [Thermomicrobiales bacterium]|nr:AbrB/MazE/SpoVT family DNA-binding domain-containing protein [Thermomicrobiales bacterium]